MFKIKKSSIHGKGVFAENKISSGREFFCDILILNLDYTPDEIGTYVFPIKRYKHPEGNVALCIGFGSFLNHSRKKPNIKLKDFDLKKKIGIFKTIKGIDKDEELLMDYGISFQKKLINYKL